MSSVRYFIALLPPAHVQAEVTAIKQEVHQRFNSRAALRSPPHITLQAPFEWIHIQDLRQVLGRFSASRSAFPVQLKGFGSFAQRVIYIHVERSPDLQSCQHQLALHLAEQLGLQDPRSRHREFTPHMTVAFRDLTRRAYKAAWPEFETRPFSQIFQANTLTLLIHTGQRWQVDSTFPLLGVVQ